MSAAALATLGAGFLNTAGSVYTNALNAANARSINKDNIALQYAINADQIEAARMNNQTAIDLANTAHQREVRDLRDAGLNPILSTHGSGADSPSLQAPSLGTPHAERFDQVNPLSGVASAVAQAVQVDDAHKTSELERKILDSSIPTYGIDALKEQAQQEVNTANAELRNQETQAKLDDEIGRLKLEALKSSFMKSNRYDTFRNLKVDDNLQDLIIEGFISELKDAANQNWRNNLGAAGSAVSSGASLLPLLKGRNKGRVPMRSLIRPMANFP